MDLLYLRYSNPLELMNIYINQGQFGEFVEKIIEAENKRLQKEQEKEEDNKLWLLYVHSNAIHEMSFNEWKNKALGIDNQEDKSMDKSKNDYSKLSMTDEDIKNQIKKSKSILKRFDF